MSSRSLNKAKRRQESGKGSSGGSRLLNLFRHYIIYSTAQLELKKGTVRAKSRKCCEIIYPHWMSRVVCPPSFSESRRQHQEPDGITEIGRFRQKFQVNHFFEMLQQFSAVGSSPRTRMSRSSCGHRGLDADGCGVEYVTALSEVKWREPATISDRVLTGYGVDRDGAWIPARWRWKELESLSLVSPWACSWLIAQSFLKYENLNVIFIHVFQILCTMWSYLNATCPVEAWIKRNVDRKVAKVHLEVSDFWISSDNKR